MKTVHVKRKLTADAVKSKQGLFFSLASSQGTVKDVQPTDFVDPFWAIVQDDVKLIDQDTNEIIFIFTKNVISHDNANIAYKQLMPVAKSNSNSNRGIAGGMLDMDKIYTTRPNFQVGKQTKFRVYPLLKTGQVGKTHYCNPVSSSIVGWTDIPKRDDKETKCRMTAFTAKHFDKFKETWSFFEEINSIYQKLAPEHWQKQCDATNNTIALIGNTVFSTITVNHVFRSALHKDAGDYKDGLGAFCVHQSADSGGELLFPEYGVAVRVCTGDVLLFNSHLWHCTAPITADDRLTFVCYLRMNIPRNCPKRTG